MDQITEALTRCIKTLTKNPDAAMKNLFFRLMHLIIENKLNVYLPIITDDKGNTFFATIGYRKGLVNGIPLVMTEKNDNGEIYSAKLVSESFWLTFYTDDKFFNETEEINLGYGPLKVLFDHYTKYKDEFLGIIINPYSEENTLYLSDSQINIILNYKL